MLTTREPRAISSKCIVLDPDSEPDTKRSSAKKNLSPDDFIGSEITDYEGTTSTKRTTLFNPTTCTFTRKSLTGTAGSQSCLHKLLSRLDPSSKLAHLVNSNQTKTCGICSKPTTSTLISANLCKKYITSKDSYDLKVINDIIYNESSHIVAVFKEFLIYDDVSEFLRRFYKTSEAMPRLTKVNDYYAKYSKVFPNYFLFKESKYMFKNIKRKQRWIDEQQKIAAEVQQRQSNKIPDEDDDCDEDKLFTTHCMNEINKTDSILGQSQRYPAEPKDPEAKICSYLKSQESIKGGNKRRDHNEKSTHIEELGLPELVEKFILKDSISVINVSTAMGADPVTTAKTSAAAVPIASVKATLESHSRPTSRPRNLPSKEAWAEPKNSVANTSSHRSAGARAASVAALSHAVAPKPSSVRQPHEEKPLTARSKSQDKGAGLLTKNPRDSTAGSTLNIKIPSSVTNAASKRSRSNTTKSGTTTAVSTTSHSRNHLGEKQPARGSVKIGGGSGCATQRAVDGLATARSSSHKEAGIPRGKTTSQTPRPTTASHNSHSNPVAANALCMSKSQPQNNIQKAINTFLAKGSALRSSHDLSRDGSKLRNLKGVAIDLEATNHKLQKHAGQEVTAKNAAGAGAATMGQTPGHGRRYKSDYLNSLMNNQNVPIGGCSAMPQGKGKVEVRTPPDFVSKARPETAMGGYYTTTATAPHSRPTLAVKDDNKRPSITHTVKSGGPKMPIGRSSGPTFSSTRSQPSKAGIPSRMFCV